MWARRHHVRPLIIEVIKQKNDLPRQPRPARGEEGTQRCGGDSSTANEGKLASPPGSSCHNSHRFEEVFSRFVHQLKPLGATRFDDDLH